MWQNVQKVFEVDILKVIENISSLIRSSTEVLLQSKLNEMLLTANVGICD